MGLNRHSLNILFELNNLLNKKIIYKNIITIGRQGIHEESIFLKRFFKQKGLDIEIEGFSFCEKFFKRLGVEQVDSIDYSSFEGCTIVHDMNKSITKPHHNKYDLVIDGGSLEHIFDVKTSISNCMNMVKEGGYFISFFPTNNFTNHGFYQFSPELFFRCFSEENGFEEGKTYLYFEKKKLNLYELIDPKILNRRNQFKSNKYTMGFFISKKIEHRNLIDINVNQSDYQTRWSKKELTNRKTFNKKIIDRIKQFLPSNFKKKLHNIYEFILLIKRGFGIIDKEGIKKIY